MSQLKAHLDKNVKLEPVESSKGETTAGSVVTSAITLPAAQVTSHYLRLLVAKYLFQTGW